MAPCGWKLGIVDFEQFVHRIPLVLLQDVDVHYPVVFQKAMRPTLSKFVVLQALSISLSVFSGQLMLRCALLLLQTFGRQMLDQLGPLAAGVSSDRSASDTALYVYFQVSLSFRCGCGY